MKVPKINKEKYYDFSNHFLSMFTSKYPCYNNLNCFLNDVKLSKNNLVSINQIHSSKIIYAKKAGFYGNADGIISNIKYNTVLSIVTADCVPIFIFDKTSGLFGIIHAGWRGLVDNIHIKSIDFFLNKDALCKTISVFLGPFIQSCCYEIKDDILHNFKEKYVLLKNKKYFLDLSTLIIDDFIKMGISNEKILNSNICTYENMSCCSFRRDGENASRMYSLIGCKQ